MTFAPVRPMLYTSELEATKDFYVNILGFTCGEYDADWGWASLIKDEAEIMLSLPNAHIPFERPFFTGSFYINVDDVDALWNEIKDRAKVCYAIENFEWGMREFGIYDNNGYLLQFGQPI